MSTTKRPYAQVGLGGRSMAFLRNLTGDFAASNELVAVCDNNPGRLELHRRRAEEHGAQVTCYAAADFDRMVQKENIDVVVVTTKDCVHDHYICRAMELGCDVITEKPMTTDEHKCRRILDTQAATGKDCRVAFNYRYAPPRTQLKDLLMSGVIGGIVSVDFHWLLNTSHGADYFRRWHRNKKNSGGLLVHKATHHFDLVNWWLSSVPETVYASGDRKYYVPETAARYGLDDRGERCHDCAAAERCPFFLDMENKGHLKALYLDNEEYDGYFRDRCVFSDTIDIEDTMQLVVNYRSGASMSYSLQAFMPWEGYTVAFNGTRGRIEHVCRESVYINGDGTTPGELELKNSHTTVFPHFHPAYQVELWSGKGGHGGGDPVLMKDLFADKPAADKYCRAADQRAGAWSIMTGIAANHSIRDGQPKAILDLVGPIAEPDYPEMPSLYSPIPEADRAAIIKEQQR